MNLRFPYLEQPSQFLPAIDITIAAGSKSLTVKALVDSGASISMFRAEIADYLGLRLERGEPIRLQGIGGRILGYRHRLAATIGARRFTLPVVFSRKFTVSLNLIGRAGFFDEFIVCFDEQTRLVVLRR